MRRWIFTLAVLILLGGRSFSARLFTATVYAGPRLDLITNAEFVPIVPIVPIGSVASNVSYTSNASNASNASIASYAPYVSYSPYAPIIPIAPTLKVATEWSPLMVKDKTIAKREEGLDMKGVVPELTEAFGPDYVTINEAIDKTVATKITAAKEARAKSISLTYTIYHSDELVSIVLYDTVKSASSKEGVASVNFRTDTGEIVGLTDAVGLNIIPLAEKLLTEKIRRNPDQYNATFDTLSADQPFYLTNNRVVLLFNEFQLTVSAEGVSALEMLLSRIDYVVVNNKSTGYYTKPGYYNLKMVQLRQVCNGLNYEVDWDPGEQRVDVYRDGTLIIELTIGINNYQVREKVRSLEAAPEIVRDNVYVPISFFDQILSLVAYSVDDRDNITFISYRNDE